jgi:hypothetical protein
MALSLVMASIGRWEIIDTTGASIVEPWLVLEFIMTVGLDGGI